MPEASWTGCTRAGVWAGGKGAEGWLASYKRSTEEKRERQTIAGCLEERLWQQSKPGFREG